MKPFIFIFGVPLLCLIIALATGCTTFRADFHMQQTLNKQERIERVERKLNKHEALEPVFRGLR